MLGENCPVATPTTEDSNMSLAEQSGAANESAAPVQRESSVENQPSAESRQTSSPIQEEAMEGDSSLESGSGSDSDSGSSSESSDENEPELESSAVPAAPSEGSPDLPPREDLSVIQGAHADRKQGSQELRTVPSSKENQTKKKSQPINSGKSERQGSQNKQPSQPLKSLIRFPCDRIFYRWYRPDDDYNIFRLTIAGLGIKGDEGYINGLVRVLTIAADVILESREAPCDRKRYYEILTQKHKSYFRDTPDDEKPSICKFDNYLYCWALKIWSRALDIIHERCRR